MKKNISFPPVNNDVNLTSMTFASRQRNKDPSLGQLSPAWKGITGCRFATFRAKHNVVCNSLFLLLLVGALLFAQITYADIQITGIRKGQTTLNVYTEPSAATKKGAIPVDQIKELSQGKSLEVLDQAVNGRYLKVNINGEALWIKAKQVNSTQAFDVGSCEQSKAITGVRGAVNCTK